jgi:hypothetical protein
VGLCVLGGVMATPLAAAGAVPDPGLRDLQQKVDDVTRQAQALIAPHAAKPPARAHPAPRANPAPRTRAPAKAPAQGAKPAFRTPAQSGAAKPAAATGSRGPGGTATAASGSPSSTAGAAPGRGGSKSAPAGGSKPVADDPTPAADRSVTIGGKDVQNGDAQTLPFTGLSLALLLAAGILISLGGLFLRRSTRAHRLGPG